MSLTRAELRSLHWRKARRSIGNGDCVEIAPANGNIVFRDSKDPEGPAVSYPAGAFRSFLDGLKRDEAARLADGGAVPPYRRAGTAPFRPWRGRS
jgi:hypothetical protein